MALTIFSGVMDNNSSACIGLGCSFNVKETTPRTSYLREGEEPLSPRSFMQGDVAGPRRLSLALVVLLVLPLFSGVQAQGGAVLIEEASFGISDYATVESTNLSTTLEVHEMVGSTANITLLLKVESLEGSLLFNQTQTLSELGAFEHRNISANFTGLPYGFSKVTAELLGEVGSNTSTHSSSISRTVQRLRPLSISLGGVGSIVSEPVHQNGSSTTNLSLNAGDYLRIAFPIINDGDVNWTGGAVVDLHNNGQHEQVLLENASVDASSSSMVTLEPTLQLTEGALSWWVNLTGDVGTEPGTHELNGTWTVGPPPLAMLEAELSSDADEVEAGETLTVHLQVWNNGTVSYAGGLSCLEDGVVVLNLSDVRIDSDTSSNWTFERSAKPMVVVCETVGARIAPSSTFPVILNIAMPSAVFESAGSSTPTLSGGPWHKGDTVAANLLLRNTGVLDGRVRLVLAIDSSVAQGTWVELSEGSAGEVTSSMQLLNDGTQTLSWSLESDDGLVVGADEGTLSMTVRAQQSVGVSLMDVNKTANEGVQFTVELNLDEGNERTVRLQVGYETGDSTVFLQENDLLLQQGTQHLTFSFGDVEADSLVAQISPVGWLIGPGPLASTASLPDDATVYWIEFSSTTDPIRPVQGDRVNLQLTVRQTGPFQHSQGDVWVVDSYDTSLAKVTSPAWQGESERVFSTEITWPKGSNVALQALWHVNGDTVSTEVTYVSGDTVDESTNQWPLAAIAWGLMLGGAVSLVLRLRAQKQHGPQRKKEPTKGKSSTTTSVSKDEKREVSCPECDRRLRVPVSYSGNIGCPDCSFKFTVEASAPPSSQIEAEDDDDIEIQETVKEESPEKIEIGCPACDQTLRIPRSYQGSVRCPSCTQVFKADEGLRLP